MDPIHILIGRHIALFSDVYHFSIGISGLAYIGLGVGFISATLASAHIGNIIYAKVRVST